MKKLKKGKIFYTSWGYGQTQYNFIKVIEISDTGKTVVCKMARIKKRESAGKTHVREEPGIETYGERFRLQVRNDRKRIKLRGSYPYIDGKKSTGMRLDTFHPHAEGKNYLSTRPNCGH